MKDPIIDEMVTKWRKRMNAQPRILTDWEHGFGSIILRFDDNYTFVVTLKLICTYTKFFLFLTWPHSWKGAEINPATMNDLIGKELYIPGEREHVKT